MAINFKDIEVKSTPESPFEGDKLNRSGIVHSLYSLANELGKTGCVLAINGEWGSGKTTLIHMWQNFIEKQGGRSLFFNAWETDFVEDPLIALMGELKAIFPESPERKNLLAKSGRIVAKVGGELLKGVVKKTIGIDSNIISATIDEATDICIESINEYEKSKDELVDFKKLLIEFVASETKDYPIIFFIDELDRCSPHYAIKVLERVKHLFEVPNIVFVISVNLNQLQFAVEGFYGSTNINGREYLRRFIDLEYILPEPNIENYVKMLFENLDFAKFFNEQAINNYNSRSSEDMVKYVATALLSKSNLNFRVINKIMANFRLVINSYNFNTTSSLELAFFLCFFKILYPDIYNKIKNHEYTLQELLDALEANLSSSLFSKEKFDYTVNHMAYVISSLLIAYNYKSRGTEIDEGFKPSSNDENTATFPIKPSRFECKTLYKALFQTNERCIQILMYGLNDYFNKIDFVNGFRL